MWTYQIEITHLYVIALRCTGEDPIIRVRRNLMEYNRGGLCILHESRLNVAIIMKALGVSVNTFGEPMPALERFRIISQRLTMVFGTFYKF
jgi:hypothetical protein